MATTRLSARRVTGPARENDRRVEKVVRSLYRRQQHRGISADTVHRTLAEAIIGGGLPPGWRLAETRLASLFDVSRTPVREALTRLRSEGLVEQDERRGLVVSTMSDQEILEVYVLREALDGIAARHAARFASPVDIEHLRQLNGAMAEAANARDFARMAGLNVQFHEVLADASHNLLLLGFVKQTHRWVRRFKTTTFEYTGRALKAIAEHELIMSAIEARDGEGAEGAAREHMRKAADVRLRMQAERRARWRPT
jgi:DNA-binding GntR family transcriptional regulator